MFIPIINNNDPMAKLMDVEISWRCSSRNSHYGIFCIPVCWMMVGVSCESGPGIGWCPSSSLVGSRPRAG